MSPSGLSAGRRSAALDRAEEARTGGLAPAPSAFSCCIAVGDPQAPTSRFFESLDHHGLIEADGWLRRDVQLVSVGDHFDYGGFDQRQAAGQAGLLSLSWLAAHSPEQVTLIAGNHDLARVGELHSLSDERFNAAAERASVLYRARPRDVAADGEFLREFPEFSDVEIAARDLATFSEAQRALVLALLVSGRFRLAHAVNGVLVCHAGVTKDDLATVGVVGAGASDASSAATALNQALERAVSGWDREQPFSIPNLHQPGSAANGEGGGILYHRPAQSTAPLADFSGPHRRRFDPRRLPIGLTQVVGHVRDGKCRGLLGTWVTDSLPTTEGSLRHLVTDGQGVRYASGSPLARTTPSEEVATLHFLDGGMNHVPATSYELCDLTTGACGAFVGRSWFRTWGET